jgi:hypothetical protein
VSQHRLNIAADVAKQVPAAHLAQMEATFDDPDSGCVRCGRPFEDETVQAVLLRDGDFLALRLTHRACAPSGVYEAPGLRAMVLEKVISSDGVDVDTSLGRRRRRPRALVFLEPTILFSSAPPGAQLVDAADPLGIYATQLGLGPITGQLDQISPQPTTTSRLYVHRDGLLLRSEFGDDTIPADRDTLIQWCNAAREDDATAIVITARGLGLNQQPPTIAEAIATRPAWAARVDVDGLPEPRRPGGRPRWWFRAWT